MSSWDDYCDGLVRAGWQSAAIVDDLQRRGFDSATAHRCAALAFQRSPVGAQPSAIETTRARWSSSATSVSLTLAVLNLGCLGTWLLLADQRYRLKPAWILGSLALLLFGVLGILNPRIAVAGRKGRRYVRLMGADGARIFVSIAIVCVVWLTAAIGFGVVPQGPSDGAARWSSGCGEDLTAIAEAIRVFQGERRRSPLSVSELGDTGYLEVGRLNQPVSSWVLRSPDGVPLPEPIGVVRCAGS